MGDLSSTGLKAKLSNLAKQPLTVPVRIGDGDGLHLLVKPSGKPREQGQDRPKPIGGTWVLRYTFAGKRRDMGLGPYPAVSLADARDAAEKARRLIRNGSDPVADRDAARDAEAKAAAAAQARAVTFKEAALATVEAKRGGWTNPKHAGQWLATLEQHAFPHIGQKPVGEIDLSAVLTVLRPIWERIPETASRLRQRIEAVLDLAHVRGWRQAQNVARWRGLLAEELPPPRKVRRVEHRPALPWQQIPAFWQALSAVDGMGAAALRMVLLTGSRTGEVRAMRWGEIDSETRTWIVPATRMKSRRLHRVPLSRQAIALLDDLREGSARPGDLVFPSVSGAMISDMTVSAVVRRMNEADEKADPGSPPRWRDQDGRAIVPHGLRSTFRDWAGETRSDGWEVVESALAHALRDRTAAAYARSDLLEKRRPLMQAWADWVTANGAGAVVRRAGEGGDDDQHAAHPEMHGGG